MIGGASRGKGDYNLWHHPRDDKKQNDATFAGASNGLVQQGITDQIKELTNIGRYASHSKLLYHIHVDPAKDWAPQEWEVYWQDYEKEFSLEKQPFSESIHMKHRRKHKHRVYSPFLPFRACIRMDTHVSAPETSPRICRSVDCLKPGHQKRTPALAWYQSI